MTRPAALQVDPARRALMQRVRRSRTDLEDEVGRLLTRSGLRYRRNVKGLPGSPDFANRARGWAVFVNGCFWHFHTGCRLSKIPAANAAFWAEKKAANRARDARKIRDLRRLGYRVLVIWQCQLDRPEEVRRRLAKLASSARQRSRRAQALSARPRSCSSTSRRTAV